MLQQLKRVFGGASSAQKNPSHAWHGVSAWAAAQGYAFSTAKEGGGFLLRSKVGPRPWTLEKQPASREFITDDELYARAELGIHDEVAVVIMNRSLKKSLEKQAYKFYTDPLQTYVSPNLPDEMRWLSIYRETAWTELPEAFWARYSVMADQPRHAASWIDSNLAKWLLAWPEEGPDSDVPFMLMVLRGKVFLRMQYTPATLATLHHAVAVYNQACQSALAGLSAGKTPVLT